MPTFDDLLGEAFSAPVAPKKKAPTFDDLLGEAFGAPPQEQLPPDEGLPIQSTLGPAESLAPLQQGSLLDARTAANAQRPGMDQLGPAGRRMATAIEMDNTQRDQDEVTAEKLSQLAEMDAKAAKNTSRNLEISQSQANEFAARMGVHAPIMPKAAEAPKLPERNLTPEQRKIYDRELAKHLSEEDSANYAKAQAMEAASIAATNPMLKLPPGIRDVGVGLQKGGLLVGSIPYAIKDLITGSEDSKAITAADSEISAAHEASNANSAVPQWVHSAITGAVSNLTSMELGGGHLGKHAGKIVGGLTSAASALGEAQEAGLNRKQAFLYAAMQGIIEGGFEHIAGSMGHGGIEDIVSGNKKLVSKGMMAAVKEFGKTYLEEAGTEIPTSIAQEWAKRIFSDGRIKSATTAEDYAIVARDTLAQTFAMTGTTHGAAHISEIGQYFKKNAAAAKAFVARGGSRKAAEDAGFKGRSTAGERAGLVERLKSTFDMSGMGNVVSPGDKPEVRAPYEVPSQMTPQEAADHIAWNRKSEKSPVNEVLNQAGIDQRKADQKEEYAKNGVQGLVEAADQTPLKRGLKKPDWKPNAVSDAGLGSTNESAPEADRMFNDNLDRTPAENRRAEDDAGYVPDQKEIAPTPDKQHGSLLDEFEAEQQERLKQRVAGDRRVSIANPHPVTGLIEGKAANQRLAEMSVERAISGGKTVTYAEGDFHNLGGLNGVLGQTAADVHLKAITEIATKFIPKGADVALVHKGGDEFGFHFIGMGKTEVQSLLDKAAPEIAAYVKENGLDKISHTKTGKAAGAGINFAVEQFNPAEHQSGVYKDKKGKDIKLNAAGALIYAADNKLEEVKKHGSVKGSEVGAVGQRRRGFRVAKEATQREASGTAPAKSRTTENGAQEAPGAERKPGFRRSILAAAERATVENQGVQEAPAKPASELKRGLKKPLTGTFPADAADDAGPQDDNIRARMMSPSIPLHTQNQKTGDAAPISNHEIVENMRQRFKLPIRIGRIGLKKAAGIYKRIEQIARTQIAGDLGPATHEVAHHIDEIYNAVSLAPQKIKDAMGALDYDPSQRRPSEGFAEFVRKYWTEDFSGQSQEFEEVRQWFENELLSKFSTLKSIVAQTGEDVLRYRNQGSEERVNQSIGDDWKKWHPVAWLKKQSQVLNRKFKDKLSPIALYEKELLAAGANIPAGARPYQMAAYYDQSAAGHANRAVDEGVFLLSTGQKIGPSLQSVLDGLPPDQYEKFIAFAKSRHALEMHQKDVDPGISKADAQFVFDKYKDNKAFVKAAEKLTEFNNSMLEVLYDAGVKTRDEINAMKQAWDTYMPMTRVHENAIEGGGGGAKGLMPGDPIKKREGGGQATRDPIEATLLRTLEIYDAAAKQMVLNSIVESATKARGMGRWVEELPGSQTDRGEGIVAIIKNGKKTSFQLDPELFKAVTSMDSGQLPYAIGALSSMGTHFVKMGATGISTPFAIKNFMRDLPGYFMHTSRSWADPKTWTDPFTMIMRYSISGMRELAGLKPDPLVKMWKDHGGDMSTAMSRDWGKLDRKRKEMLASKFQQRAYNIVTNPFDAISKILGVSEVGPRMAEFIGVLEKAGYTRADIKAGKVPPMEKIIEAMRASAEITVNFKRTGEVGQQINKMVPYFNAPLEGTVNAIRKTRENPKRTLIRGVIGILAPTIAYWLKHHDDDWYEEQPDWLKYGTWTFTEKDLGLSKDEKPVFRVPTPDSYGLVFKIMPQALLDAAKKDGGSKHIVAGLKQSANFIPNLKPAIVTPLLESYFNYDTFRDQPIVGVQQQKLEARDQYRPETTELAKKMGEHLDMSPAKIEHILDGLSGGMYTGVERKTEAVALGKTLNKKDYPFISGVTVRRDYSRSQDEFYDELDATEKKFNSAKLRGEPPAELEQKLALLKDYAGIIKEMRASVRDEPDRDKAFESEKYIIGLSRYALGKKDLERYPSPFKADTLPEAAKEAVNEFITKRLNNITGTPPMKLTDKDREKGLTLPKKREQFFAERDAAVKELKSLEIEKSDARKLLWIEAKKLKTDTARDRKMSAFKMVWEE